LQRIGLTELTGLGEHAYASTVAADLAHCLLRLGRDDEAEAAMLRARELCPPGDIGTIMISGFVEAQLHLRRGRLEDAERVSDRMLQVAATTDFWEYRGVAHEVHALVLNALGRRPEATRALETAARVYGDKGATVAEGRARALLAEL
jgi:tetratricopeptide (TPR) repeat protein